MSDKFYLSIGILIVLVLGFYFVYDWRQEPNLSLITNFEECAAAGYPIMESYPEQCRTLDGRLFVRDIDNLIIDGLAACTKEAKICPDGSAVGRTGPNCEFSPCPGEENSLVPITLAEELVVPWEIAFLPGGDMLVTERPGRLVRIGLDRQVIEVQGVAHRGEGGLLGLALDPNFKNNNLIYLYLTTLSSGDITNRVERYRLGGATLSGREVIIEGIPGASNHDGGRIAFGPDGLLYIATGDAGNADLAQNINSLAGKILRLNSDGTIPRDNPFGNPVYSYGHRNPQGLAWDRDGGLWSTEHGRSGIRSDYDELNYIERGANYGWPEIQGDETREGMKSPVVHSGANVTWAPAGLAYIDNKLYFAGLRGASLYEVSVIGVGALGQVQRHFSGEYGRLRAVVVGPGGSLIFSTSNRDGRGRASSQDDRIIQVDPKTLGF